MTDESDLMDCDQLDNGLSAGRGVHARGTALRHDAAVRQRRGARNGPRTGAEEGDTDEEALDRFVDRLNQRIKNMGLTDTNLVNPDGWAYPATTPPPTIWRPS